MQRPQQYNEMHLFIACAECKNLRQGMPLHMTRIAVLILCLSLRSWQTRWRPSRPRCRATRLAWAARSRASRVLTLTLSRALRGVLLAALPHMMHSVWWHERCRRGCCAISMSAGPCQTCGVESCRY